MQTRTPFHQRHSHLLTENIASSEAQAGMAVLEAFYHIELDSGTLYDFINAGQGAFETRDEALALGICLERTYRNLGAHFEKRGVDGFEDLMEEAYGAFDFEWIPEMVLRWHKDPDITFYASCLADLDKLAESRALSASTEAA